MKITQGDPKPKFEPITIVLETYEEAEAFKLMGNVSSAVATGVEQGTTSYHISTARYDAIKQLLYQIWCSPPFQALDVKQYDAD